MKGVLKKTSPLSVITLALVASLPLQAQGRYLNGFEVSDSSIPADEIHRGGPPRDGIPSIDEPVYIEHEEAEFLGGSDRVLGAVIDGQAYAYPIGIMNYHEIVNHQSDDGQMLITYCPLCGTGMVFDAEVDGQRLNFGVSGLLYNSDLLMYDRETESLWPQIKGEAVTGAMKGQTLELMPSLMTSWGHWLDRHEDALVLSQDTGHRRNYSRSPYGDYEDSAEIFFPLAERDDRFHPKAWVIGLEAGGEARAWAFDELEATGHEVVEDEFAGQSVFIHYDSEARAAEILDSEGEAMASTTGFWFAWYAFNPETTVFEAGQ